MDCLPPTPRSRSLRYAPGCARSLACYAGSPSPSERSSDHHPPLGQCELDMMDVLLWRNKRSQIDSWSPPGGKQRLFMTTPRHKKALLPAWLTCRVSLTGHCSALHRGPVDQGSRLPLTISRNRVQKLNTKSITKKIEICYSNRISRHFKKTLEISNSLVPKNDETFTRQKLLKF